MKQIDVDFRDKVRKFGVDYFNLSEFVERKLREEAAGAKIPVSEKVLQENELRGALRQLKEDNFIKLFGDIRNPNVRFIYE